MSNNLKLDIKNILIFSLMALPLAMFSIPLYIYVPEFYASNYPISLTSIAFILLLIRVIEAFLDPIIGIFCDYFINFKKTIFLTSSIILAIGLYLIYNPLEIANKNIIMWFSLSIFLSSIGFSIATINHSTYAAMWANEYTQKTRIFIFKESFTIIGLILASAIFWLLFNSEGSNIYKNYSVIIITIHLFCTFIFIKFWLAKFTLIKAKQKQKFSWIKLLSSIKENKNFFIIYAISALSSSIPAVLIIFFIKDKLDLEKFSGLFLISYFAAGALSMPLWQKIAKLYGKIICWRISMILAIFVFTWAFFLQKHDFYAYLVICILSGAAFACELALPSAILADNVEEKNATTNFAILAFFSKLTLAIATIITLPIIEYYQFKTGSLNDDKTLTILSFMYAILPCIIKLCAFFASFKLNLHNYNISFKASSKSL